MIIDPVGPALAYLSLNLPIGWAVARRTDRPLRGSLMVSGVLLALWVALSRWLPFSFATYARDLIWEPLIRNFPYGAHPLETVASAAFHLGAPALILGGWRLWAERRRKCAPRPSVSPG